MLQNIVKGHRVTMVSFSRVFNWRNDPGAGFSFDCNEQGEINTSELADIGWENLQKCLSGEYDVIDMGIQRYEHRYWSPGFGTCTCGQTVTLDGDTRGEGIDCECGRIYNAVGQELAPRRQWEEYVGDDY